MINDTGLGAIENYVDGLSESLCDGLAGRNYDIVSSRRPGERSAIVCIKHQGGLDSAEISNRLEKAGVIVSARADRLRIATHFYNDQSDIDRLLDALP